jgi:hypothetical protein
MEDKTIHVIDKSYNRCKNLINSSNKLNIWERTKVGNNQVNLDFCNSFCCYISNNKSLKKYDDSLYTIFSEALQSYAKQIPLPEISKDEGYALMKYDKDGFFKPHTDIASGEKLITRTITAVLFLNDDFKGGDLYFPHQDKTVKPVKGKMVLFPCNYAYLYETKQVTSGTQYQVVTWFHV